MTVQPRWICPGWSSGRRSASRHVFRNPLLEAPMVGLVGWVAPRSIVLGGRYEGSKGSRSTLLVDLFRDDLFGPGDVFASTPARRSTPVIDGRLPSLDRLPEHRKLLERAVAGFWDDVRVVGLVAGGSLARGEADFYSDVDLYIVVQDAAFDELFAGRDAIVVALGSPLFGFDVDPMPGGSTDHIVIYEGPVKFDFMYLKESDLKPAPKWTGCQMLKDA